MAVLRSILVTAVLRSSLAMAVLRSSLAMAVLRSSLACFCIVEPFLSGQSRYWGCLYNLELSIT